MTKRYYGIERKLIQLVQPIDGRVESHIVRGRNRKLAVKRLVLDGILEIVAETDGSHGIIIYKLNVSKGDNL